MDVYGKSLKPRQQTLYACPRNEPRLWYPWLLSAVSIGYLFTQGNVGLGLLIVLKDSVSDL